MFWALLLVAAVVSFSTGCQKEVIPTESEARNIISGVANGIAFRSANLAAVKDSSDVFLLAGTMGTSGSVLVAFAGKDEKEYVIAEDGAFVALTNYLNELIAADSFFIDTTALQTIFSDTAQILPEGSAFMFFIPEGVPFFSRRGNLTLTTFDGTINRIYGTIEGEFINAEEGPIYVNAIFEDVFYLDCGALNTCGF